MKKTILLFEDDKDIATLLSHFMEKHDFEVLTEANGERVLEAIREHEPDAIILDVNLPGKDGFEVCKEARTIFDDPIIMLTARDQEIDEIIGLELGADDYITKPADPQLILAHLRACLRRIDTITQSFYQRQVITYGIFSIDKSTRTVMLGKKEIALASSDFELLWFLASKAGQIVTRDDIKLELRGIVYDGQDRSIDMRISRLRKRLKDDPTAPKRIKTVRGEGYLFNVTGWE